eukprot:CAMPEP_0170599752 /NCGR_PEP_ID=MMETSP0224-20130122/16969_1 /TAXON_ID=285029 /ORGANISM="Togula jolla, Strain CCCM 725" /LENGTH=263 /DNA_ID=CAMNT_0010924433 /DNA_START=283 /DNA_END=1075 /DNA_ORIENTATION=+
MGKTHPVLTSLVKFQATSEGQRPRSVNSWTPVAQVTSVALNPILASSRLLGVLAGQSTPPWMANASLRRHHPVWRGRSSGLHRNWRPRPLPRFICLHILRQKAIEQRDLHPRGCLTHAWGLPRWNVEALISGEGVRANVTSGSSDTVHPGEVLRFRLPARSDAVLENSMLCAFGNDVHSEDARPLEDLPLCSEAVRREKHPCGWRCGKLHGGLLPRTREGGPELLSSLKLLWTPPCGALCDLGDRNALPALGSWTSVAVEVIF